MTAFADDCPFYGQIEAPRDYARWKGLFLDESFRDEGLSVIKLHKHARR